MRAFVIESNTFECERLDDTFTLININAFALFFACLPSRFFFRHDTFTAARQRRRQRAVCYAMIEMISEQSQFHQQIALRSVLCAHLALHTAKQSH